MSDASQLVHHALPLCSCLLPGSFLHRSAPVDMNTISLCISIHMSLILLRVALPLSFVLSILTSILMIVPTSSTSTSMLVISSAATPRTGNQTSIAEVARQATRSTQRNCASSMVGSETLGAPLDVVSWLDSVTDDARSERCRWSLILERCQCRVLVRHCGDISRLLPVCASTCKPGDGLY